MVKAHDRQHHLHSLDEIVMIVRHLVCLFDHHVGGSFLWILRRHAYRTLMAAVARTHTCTDTPATHHESSGDTHGIGPERHRDDRIVRREDLAAGDDLDVISQPVSSQGGIEYIKCIIGIQAH